MLKKLYLKRGEEDGGCLAEAQEKAEKERQREDAEWNEMRKKIKEPDIDILIKEEFQSDLGRLCGDLAYILRALGVDDRSIRHYLFAQLDMVERLDRPLYLIDLKKYFSKLFQCDNF